MFVLGSWSNTYGTSSAKTDGLNLSKKGGCASVSGSPLAVTIGFPSRSIGGPLLLLQTDVLLDSEPNKSAPHIAQMPRSGN